MHEWIRKRTVPSGSAEVEKVNPMIKIVKMIEHNKANCAGCYACYSVCPKKAITMQEDEEGFRYPVVNDELCIQCEACGKVCPVMHPVPVKDNAIPQTYAAINEDWEVRRESSSGGVFHLLAEKILEAGGTVFGAGFDENWEVCHQEVYSKEQLPKLQVSKYVQSRIEDTFMQVRKELQQGKKVLFSGTPCQCAGLQSYLQRPYDNLFTVDCICHGVPSPGVWRKYLAYRRQGNEIGTISFRNKNLSWERYLLLFFFKNSNKYLGEDQYHDLYMRGFLQDLYLRPSCSVCKFRKQNRPVDITLADYWGVQEAEPEMYDGKGTSLVFIQSEKGKKLFDQIQAKKKVSDFERAVSYNSSMLKQFPPSPQRAAFFKEFQENKIPIDALLWKYVKPGRKERVRDMLKHVPGLTWGVRMVRKSFTKK